MKVNDFVTVTHKPELDPLFSRRMRWARAQANGAVGVIGEGYGVRIKVTFATLGTTWFHPSELTPADDSAPKIWALKNQRVEMDPTEDRVIVIPMTDVWAGWFTFDVVYQSKRHMFRGVPNYCESARAARSRGAWRLKWLRDGTYGLRYVKASELTPAPLNPATEDK